MKTARYDQRRSLVHFCVATKRVALVCVAAFISGGIAPARADDQPNEIIVSTYRRRTPRISHFTTGYANVTSWKNRRNCSARFGCRPI